MKNLLERFSQGTFFPALILFLAFSVSALSFFAGRLSEKISSGKKIRENRSDAVKRSRAVIGGQMAEQIAPYLPDFPCNAADARFVGKPVDFIAFPGLAQGGKIEEILLIEVKTGLSKLSAREKEVRDLVEKGKVRYEEYYFSADKSI